MLFAQTRASLLNGLNNRIDQLCIDQDNDEDKAQQIPKMREIYEKAAEVIAWINPMPGSERLACNLITRLWSLKGQHSGDILENLPLSEILGPLDDDDNLRSWAAFRHLMENEYWLRAWILPEATARLDRCRVCCGSVSFPINMRSIFWAMHVLRGLRTRTLPPMLGSIGGSDKVMRINIFSDYRHDREGEIHLFDLLFISQRMHSSKAEDKIYSIIGFATDVGEYVDDPFLRPSYTRGPYNTYTDLIKWYLTKYRNCELHHPLTFE